jgi:hypothetical protein
MIAVNLIILLHKQEIIENRGHKKLNLLRAILGCSKTVYLNNCDFTFKGLEKTIF